MKNEGKQSKKHEQKLNEWSDWREKLIKGVNGSCLSGVPGPQKSLENSSRTNPGLKVSVAMETAVTGFIGFH